MGLRFEKIYIPLMPQKYFDGFFEQKHPTRAKGLQRVPKGFFFPLVPVSDLVLHDYTIHHFNPDLTFNLFIINSLMIDRKVDDLLIIKSNFDF